VASQVLAVGHYQPWLTVVRCTLPDQGALPCREFRKHTKKLHTHYGPYCFCLHSKCHQTRKARCL